MVTKNDKEIVLWVRRSGCDMLSNYEHALEPFKKLLRHAVKPSNIPGRKKSSKQIKKRKPQYKQYSEIASVSHFQQVSL